LQICSVVSYLKQLRGGSLGTVRHLLQSCLPWPPRSLPGAAPGRHEFSPSLPPFPALSPENTRRSRASRHGRRLPPPLNAAPCSSEALRRSASPPAVSPPKESIPRGRNRRRSRRFLRSQPSSAASNSSPPALLRPSRPRRRLPCEPLTRKSPLLSLPAP
jgi:hypothetical protein